MRRRRRAAAIALCTLVAAGCASDDMSSSPTTGPSETLATPVGTGSDPTIPSSDPAAVVTSAPAEPGSTTAGAMDTTTVTAEEPSGVWEQINPPVSLDKSDFGNQNYGTQTIALSAADPSVVYVGTCYQGIWKTTDTGTTWSKVNTGKNGANLETGRNWTLAVDPVEPEVLYTVSGYGKEQGLWKSEDGGTSWSQMLDDDVIERTTADIYSVAIDPSDHLHLLVGSHGGWSGPDAGVLESTDGGESWTVHEPVPGWGAGHYLFFVDSSTWLLGTQDAGVWRTPDAGETWDKVSDVGIQHGAGQMYTTSSGVLYLGGLQTVLRSTDQGVTWTSVGPDTRDGYNAVIGDGTTLYALPANTGFNTADPDPPFAVSPERDGTSWRPLEGDQPSFANGPMSMVFDPATRTIYSSNWLAGVWKLRV